MQLLLKFCLLLITVFTLNGCLNLIDEDDAENADACGQGDQAACDTLDAELALATEACDAGDIENCARSVALSTLIESIPQGLIIASNTSRVNAGNDSEFLDKKHSVEEFLSDTRGSSDFSTCLEALPTRPQVASPLCYGPALSYSNHPSDNSSGQLPTGDLGLWVENEPGTNQACAAAKLNELVAKAAYNVDLAVGSMTMMVCTAALLGKELPTESSTMLDLSAQLGSLPGTSIQVDKATIKKASLTNGDGYQTELEATINSKPIALSVLHDATNNKGVMQIETTEASHSGGTDVRGTSVVYELSDTIIKYKIISSRVQPISNAVPEVSYATDGQITLQGGEDIHVIQAQINAADGYGSLAYAWKAGGGDDHYRALNVVTESANNGSGRAYYGYVPSPASGSEAINLDLAHASAGMICNWAGPGNSHTVADKVQYQGLSLSNGDWIASSSNITYVPTTSCDMAMVTGTFTPAFGGPDNDVAYADMSAEQKAVVDNGTLDSSAGAVTNDLLLRSSIVFSLPSAPSVPE